jgi:hypothetical protein
MMVGDIRIVRPLDDSDLQAMAWAGRLVKLKRRIYQGAFDFFLVEDPRTKERARVRICNLERVRTETP